MSDCTCLRCVSARAKEAMAELAELRRRVAEAVDYCESWERLGFVPGGRTAGASKVSEKVKRILEGKDGR